MIISVIINSLRLCRSSSKSISSFTTLIVTVWATFCYWCSAKIKYSQNIINVVSVFDYLIAPTSRAFCCADILCYFSPVLSLSKDRKLRVYSKARLCSWQLGLQLISDMSIRIYSEASIAENPLLGGRCLQVLFERNTYLWRKYISDDCLVWK